MTSPHNEHFLGVSHFAGAYTLEAVLMPCSLCNVFAGFHTLPQLRRGLSQTDAKLLRCASFQPIVCVKDESVVTVALQDQLGSEVCICNTIVPFTDYTTCSFSEFKRVNLINKNLLIS